MVWGLLPVNPSLGLPTYYFFSKGTYKIGRKDCDVIIEKDRTISRIHADVIIDWDPLQIKLHGHSKVLLTDHSKFGTFINNESGSKPIFSLPNKQVNLKDGDRVSFGTGNAAFRFCFIPFLMFIHQTDSSKASSSVQDLVLFIGGCVLNKWSPECTHVVVDALTPVTEDIIEAVMEQKPVVLGDWVKAIAERKVSTEIPHCSFYTPTLTLSEGEFSVQVKIVEPDIRRGCLAGHTFMLGSPNMYKFGNKFKWLLEACGAKVSSINSSDTALAHGTDNVVLVSPVRCADAFNQCRSISQLPRINDINLIGAVLSGHLNDDLVELPPVADSQSHTTDETIVADSDVEVDSVTSQGNAAVAQREVLVYENKVNPLSDVISQRKSLSHFGEDGCMMERKSIDMYTDLSKYQTSEVIYSQDLIVKNDCRPESGHSVNENVVNFKCFRKREYASGNSFKDLIPFSKDPYIETEGQSEREKFVREEKKRKQAESIAEDLFNSERVKRQKGTVTSSLRNLILRH
ncbi:nibrin homolog isoform X2 [Nymphaea colorata]|nr:nibrin homolog isoform X2 [Nymphaea colorata]